MAAGAITLYDNSIKYMIDGTIDVDTDTLKVVLLATSYTPASTHDVYADIDQDVTTTGDYSAQTLASVTVTATGGVATIDAADTSFGTGVTIGNIKYAAIVKQAATSALVTGDKLLAYMNMNTASAGATVSSSSSDFQITWNSSGIITAS